MIIKIEGIDIELTKELLDILPLEFYENKLLKSNKYSVIYENELFTALKKEYPHLYYQEVLQVIADHLCTGERIYEIEYLDGYKVAGYNFVTPSVLFDTVENAKKAIDLLGDKLDFIYVKPR